MEYLKSVLYVTAYSTFFYFIFLAFHNLKLYFSGISYILYLLNYMYILICDGSDLKPNIQL